MGSSRDALLVQLDELDEAFKATEAVLRSARSTYRGFGRRLVKGQLIAEIFPALEVPEARAMLNEQLEHLEIVRHRVRAATVAVGLEEGLTIGRIGRLFGFSRQLAARYAKEVREGGVTGRSGGGGERRRAPTGLSNL